MEHITIIHLNESTPFKYINNVGCMTIINANNNLNDFELFIDDFFIEAEARTYEAES